MDNKAFFEKLTGFVASVDRLRHELDKQSRPGDVTPIQYGILQHLALEQPLTLSEISDCFGMPLSNTSREVRKLTEKGLCEKRDDEEDRRRQIIRLTAKGAQAMGEAFGRMEARIADRLEAESEAEREELYRAMELLHRKVFS